MRLTVAPILGTLPPLRPIPICALALRADPRLLRKLPRLPFMPTAAPEAHWFALDKLLKGLKSRYREHGHDFELHAAQFCVGIPEQDQISDFEQRSRTERRAQVRAIRQQRIDAETNPKKKERIDKYKRTEPFTHLTRLERSKLLEDALDLVGANDKIRQFGQAISKSHPAVVVLPTHADPGWTSHPQGKGAWSPVAKRWRTQARNCRTTPFSSVWPRRARNGARSAGSSPGKAWPERLSV